MDKTRSEKSKDFQIAQYENWTKVLGRIKMDEQRWISTLLIIYGALLTFQVNKDDFLLSKTSFSLLGLSTILIINIIISFAWFHQSLNLRIQYYRSMIEIHNLKLIFNENIPKTWLVDDFNNWRKNATRPYESKIVDFILLAGLMFVSETIALIKYGNFDLDSGNCVNIITTITFSYIYIISIIFFPFIYYPLKDKKEMKKIFDSVLSRLRS